MKDRISRPRFIMSSLTYSFGEERSTRKSRAGLNLEASPDPRKDPRRGMGRGPSNRDRLGRLMSKGQTLSLKEASLPAKEEERGRTRTKEGANNSGRRTGPPPTPKGWPSAGTTTLQELVRANAAGPTIAPSRRKTDGSVMLPLSPMLQLRALISDRPGQRVTESPTLGTVTVSQLQGHQRVTGSPRHLG